jgi:hypothetical protein
MKIYKPINRPAMLHDHRPQFQRHISDTPFLHLCIIIRLLQENIMAVTEGSQLVNQGYGACKSCGCNVFGNANGGTDTNVACVCTHKYGSTLS